MDLVALVAQRVKEIEIHAPFSPYEQKYLLLIGLIYPSPFPSPFLLKHLS